MKRKTKVDPNPKVVRLAHRVEHVVSVIGFQEFTAAHVAKCLATPEADCILALRHLHETGKMEPLTEHAHDSRWRRKVVGAYKAERTKVVPLTERA